MKYKEVMKQYGLGPNGGIVTSLNLFATRFDQVQLMKCSHRNHVDRFSLREDYFCRCKYCNSVLPTNLPSSFMLIMTV